MPPNGHSYVVKKNRISNNGIFRVICKEGLHYGEACVRERDLLYSQVPEEGEAQHMGDHMARAPME